LKRRRVAEDGGELVEWQMKHRGVGATSERESERESRMVEALEYFPTIFHFLFFIFLHCLTACSARGHQSTSPTLRKKKKKRESEKERGRAKGYRWERDMEKGDRDTGEIQKIINNRGIH